jgi:hypothetical protein
MQPGVNCELVSYFHVVKHQMKERIRMAIGYAPVEVTPESGIELHTVFLVNLCVNQSIWKQDQLAGYKAAAAIKETVVMALIMVSTIGILVFVCSLITIT